MQYHWGPMSQCDRLQSYEDLDLSDGSFLSGGIEKVRNPEVQTPIFGRMRVR